MHNIDGKWKSPKTTQALTVIKGWLAEREALAEREPTEAHRQEIMSKGKIIVFSPWLSASDVLGWGLKEANIKYYKLNGGCKDSSRQETIQKFEELNDEGRPKDFSREHPDDTRVKTAKSCA